MVVTSDSNKLHLSFDHPFQRFSYREKYEQLVEENYKVEETRRVGVMQMSRVSSYSDCECDQQMQVSMQVGNRRV